MEALKDLIKSVENKQSWIERTNNMIQRTSERDIAVSASGYCETRFNPSEGERIKSLIETIIKEREEALKPQAEKLKLLSELVSK